MLSREQEPVLGQRGREIQTPGPWGAGEGRLCTLGQFRLFSGSVSHLQNKGAGLQRVGMAPASLDPPHLAWALPLPGAGGLWAVPAQAGPSFVFLGVLG